MAAVAVFGKPITLGNRTERAKAAAKYRNADGKLDQVLQASLQFEKAAEGETNLDGNHFNFQDRTRFTRGSFDQFDSAGVGHHVRQRSRTTQVARTSCFIYNATGDPITFVLTHDWQGHVAGRSPKIIQNGQWAFLKHVGTGEPNPQGSIGAIVYNIQNYADTMIAWSNPIKTPTISKNTTYVQMNDPGYFSTTVDWNEMYHAVRDCGSEYETDMEGFTTKVRIDAQGSTPRCFAEFYLDEA